MVSKERGHSFNLVFVQNLCVLIVNTYSIKIDKTGLKNDSNEAVIAPLVFTIIKCSSYAIGLVR